MTYKDIQTAIGEAVNKIRTKANEIVELADDIGTELESLAGANDKPAVSEPRVVQARIRENSTLHVQRGSEGDYEKTDVELTAAQTAAFNAAFATGEKASSLYGSPTPYLVGREFNDGSMLFGSFVLNENPFAS